MIELKLENKTHLLPTSWEEVTLEKFQKICKLNTTNKLNYYVQLLNIFTEIDEKILINLKANQFKEIIKELDFIFNEKLEDVFVNNFKIGEDKYVLKDFNTLTLGEQVSLETLIEKNDNIQNAHYFFAILFKKNNEEELNFDELEDRANSIKENLSITQINKVLIFFFNCVKTYISNMKNFLEYKEQKTKKKEPVLMRLYHCLENTSGSAWSTGWRRGILLSTKMFTNKTLSTA